MSRPSRAIIASLVVDVGLVIVFAVIGRASHDEGVSLAGVAQTAWPFLAGLVLGWLVTLGWRAPNAPVRTGLGVWAVTLVGGMLLRAASAQGTAVPFIVVAAIVLLAFLVGRRAVHAFVGHRRTAVAR